MRAGEQLQLQGPLWLAAIREVSRQSGMRVRERVQARVMAPPRDQVQLGVWTMVRGGLERSAERRSADVRAGEQHTSRIAARVRQPASARVQDHAPPLARRLARTQVMRPVLRAVGGQLTDPARRGVYEAAGTSASIFDVEG